ADASIRTGRHQRLTRQDLVREAAGGVDGIALKDHAGSVGARGSRDRERRQQRNRQRPCHHQLTCTALLCSVVPSKVASSDTVALPGTAKPCGSTAARCVGAMEITPRAPVTGMAGPLFTESVVRPSRKSSARRVSCTTTTAIG